MGSEKPPALTVVYAAKALKELDEIWDWNNKHYSSDHADEYIEFLERYIDALSTDHRRGKQVSVRPALTYILIRRKSKGHGHIAVYSVDEARVNVLHVFHTAQDWQAKLKEEAEQE